SGSQNKIVQLLISYWDSPNVFVVGDDDQSIFRFQGANIENMEIFAKGYLDLLKVVLTNNYRSVQSILDISKTLISRNNERLINKFPGLSKDLITANELLTNLEHLPAIRQYNTTKEEMAGITHEVVNLLEAGIEPGRIAVIYKENSYGEELSRYFKLKKIPVYTRRSINIINHPFAKKILALLHYLAEEHDIPYGGDELLFEILHFDFYNIPPIEIAKLTVEVNAKKYKGELTSIRRLLYDKSNTPPRTLFEKYIDPNLKAAGVALEKLIGDVSNYTLQQLFERLISEGGILSTVMKSNEKIEQMQVLTALFDFIKEESSRNPLLNVKGLMDLIDLMEKEKLSLPLAQVSGSDKGVNLLTAHGSKGLEFEYVFIAGTNANVWEKKRKGNKGYKFPDTLFSSLPGASEEEELRRLFYVAITRAEKFLMISYANYKSDGKGIERSMFIEEILDGHALQLEKPEFSEQELMEFEALQFRQQAPEIGKMEDDAVSAILEKFSMNVTALNNYLRCPLDFYYKNIIRIPSGKSENTEFGSAIHYAVQRLFEKMQAVTPSCFPGKPDMIADFKWYMIRHRENFTPDAFARRIEYGEEVLSNYYDHYCNTWPTIVAIELNLRNVMVRNVPLKGKIDKLEFTGNDVNVVDYKTGDIDKAKDKLKPPQDKIPNGGDYWRQAVFYKILIDNYEHKNWKVISTDFDFVEPDKKKFYRKEKVVIRPEDIETVTQQISMAWDKIQQRDFYTGCGKEDCHWCNFVKDNKLAVALHEMTEEEEEIAL
ncbi:MAG: ATP-dependent DNA helicase, partial [Chitinophagaceae bacterium]